MPELDDDWLAVELASIEAEMAQWSDGLKESFNSTLKPGEPPIPLGRPCRCQK